MQQNKISTYVKIVVAKSIWVYVWLCSFGISTDFRKVLWDSAVCITQNGSQTFTLCVTDALNVICVTFYVSSCPFWETKACTCFKISMIYVVRIIIWISFFVLYVFFLMECYNWSRDTKVGEVCEIDFIITPPYIKN